MVDKQKPKSKLGGIGLFLFKFESRALYTYITISLLQSTGLKGLIQQERSLQTT